MVTTHEFAQNWHRTLFDHDMSQAWQLLTEDFRRVVTYTAIGDETEQARPEDTEAIVEMLSEPSPQHPDTQKFFRIACRILQDACVVQPEMVAPGQTIRIEAPAYEVVRLYMLEDLASDTEGNPYLPPGQSARALTLITSTEEDGSMRIAGIGKVMAPGRPPTVYWEPPAQV